MVSFVSFLNNLFGKKEQTKPIISEQPSKIMEIYKDEKVSKHLPETLQKVKDVFGDDNDFCVRDIEIMEQISSSIIFISSISDIDIVSKEVIKPLLEMECSQNNGELQQRDLKSVIKKRVLFHADIMTENNISNILSAILKGYAVLFVDGVDDAFLINTYKTEKRSISQPETEQVIRGPRDGFIENLQSNIALIRSRLPIPDFRVKSMEIGKLTKSTVVICYIDGITNKALVEEVENRLSTIDIDRVLDAGYIEQFIQDNPRSPFPQIRSTERPDAVVGNLVEGRVAILVDGSPFVLLLPATFNQFYQTPEDYNERFIMVSIIRFIRLIALVFSLITPSLYVAIISYHPELIPTAFAVAVTSGRAGVPFPAVVEVFLMEAAMEVLREATVRMPKQVGGALSIVGVLVIGQAAVSAGFVSPITVVVIALTTIGSFATPSYNMAIGFRMLRFPLLFLTGILGFYGLMIGLLFVNNHVISLKSFGVPYLSPIAPVKFNGLKDTFIRGPLNWLLDRPAELQVTNQRRLVPHESHPASPLSSENNDKKERRE